MQKRFWLVCCLALSFALAAKADSVVNYTWVNSVADGWWNSPASWGKTADGDYPFGTYTAANFNGTNSRTTSDDAVVRLPDLTTKMDHLHILHRAPSKYTFDGDGTVFEMCAREEGESVRGLQAESGASFYPFQILSETASGTQAMKISIAGGNGTREAILKWTNPLLTTWSTAAKEVAISFLRGTFEFFAGKTGEAQTLQVSVAANAQTDVLISNATVKVGAFTYYGQATNNSLRVDKGGVLAFDPAGTHAVFYSGTYAYDGTNVWTVTNGGQVTAGSREATSAGVVICGSATDLDYRRNEYTFAGAETVMDFGSIGSFYIQGNTLTDVKDGVTLVLPGRSGLGYSAGPTGGSVCENVFRISGDDTKVYLMTNLTSTSANGTFTIGNNAYVTNRLVMTGGSILPLYPNGTGGANLNIGAGAGSRAVFEMLGGNVDLWVTNNSNPAVNCTVAIGPGNATLEMKGGRIRCGDLYVGRDQGKDPEKAKTHVQRLHMTGGEIICSRLYFGSSAANTTYKYQEAHADLDGGVLTLEQAFVNSTSGINPDAHGYITANGGTIRLAANNANVLRDFDYVKCGPKGLTFDAGGKTPTLAHAIENKDGEQGRLRFTGSGTTIFDPSAYTNTVTTTVLDGTTLQIKADGTMLTDIVFTNNAFLNLEGVAISEGLTVKALHATSGKVFLKPGAKIHVLTDDVDVSGLQVQINPTPAADELSDVFTFDGDVTTNASVRAFVRRLVSANSVSGKHARFSAAYDEGTGRTVVSIVFKDADEPYAEKTVWNGPAWNADGWSAGVPTSTKVASFSNASAPTSVMVPSGAEAGALELASGEDYTFTAVSEGATLDLTGDLGGMWMNVMSGTNAFNVPLILSSVLPLTVGADASVALNAGVIDGTLVKTGKGRLVLGGESNLGGALEIGGGLNEVTAATALANRAGKVTQTGDTVAFTGLEPMTVKETFDINADGEATDAVVVKTDADVTFNDFTVTKGAVVKRGAGKMTIQADKARTLVRTVGAATGYNNRVNAATAIDFAADGSVPAVVDGQYAGFTVAEGEVAIVGDPGKPVTVTMKAGAILVGAMVKGDSETAAQPTFTVDGATVDANQSSHLQVGHHVGDFANGVLATCPTLRILNGGVLSVPTSQICDNSNYEGARGLIVLTNGTLTALNSHRFYESFDPTKGGVSLYAKDSVIETTATGGSQFGHFLDGAIHADIDHSFWGGRNEPALFNIARNAGGEAFFHDGSVFSCCGFKLSTAGGTYPLTFAFDNAEWQWGGDDFTVTTGEVQNAIALYKKNRTIEMRGTGLVLKPLAGKTFTVAMPFKGEGGLVSAGEGAVAFRNDALQFTGLLDIRSGTVDLTASDDLASLTAKGPGTLKGGTITRLTLKETLEGGALSGTPVLDGVTAGSVVVDLGHDETDPLDPAALENLTVATVAPGMSVGRWKLVGTGVPKLKGTFAVEGNKVVLKSTLIPGMLLIVR